MHSRKLPIVLAVALAISLSGCATERNEAAELRQTVDMVSTAICPVPLSRAELLAVADAIDVLAASSDGPELDLLAGTIERLQDGAVACHK